MGLLEQLRQKTIQAQSAEKKEHKRCADLQKYYDKEVNPKVELVYDFLKELEQHLNYLQPDIAVDYQVPAVGRMTNLVQSDYQMNKGRREVLSRVAFQFTCQSKNHLNITLEDNPKINQLIEKLDRYGLRYDCHKTRNEQHQVSSADILIYARVTVCLVFVGVVETGGIELNISNYQELGTIKSYLTPAQIDNAFLDELGKFIMRKDNLFLKHELTNDQKEFFKELVRKEKIQRREELSVATILEKNSQENK